MIFKKIDVKPFGVEKDIDNQQKEALRKKVYVKGLISCTTKQDLESVFEVYGEIERAFILYHHKHGNSRGFGFVEFKNESSVKKCLGNTVTICGKDLTVLKALERSKRVSAILSRKMLN